MRIVFCIISLLLVVSCQKESALLDEFKCTNVTSENLTTTTDFNKNFSISYPQSWKTKLYYDNYQSEIMVADTTKSLSNTLIYDVSWNFGELNINQAFANEMNTKVSKEDNVSLKSSGFGSIDGKSYYWHLLNGTKQQRTYHLLKIYTKTGADTYLMTQTDVYGQETLNERLCQAITIFETTQFLK